MNMKCLSNKAGISDNNNLCRCPKDYMWRKELFAALLISIAIFILTIVVVLVLIPQKEKAKMEQAVVSSLDTITTDSSDTGKAL